MTRTSENPAKEQAPLCGLVLSLFPGIGLLDRGFEAEGFCVVRGPDVLWGGDVRQFHPPAGRFDGIIGGPPCQAYSTLTNLVRAKGLEPRFGDLVPEFSRVIEEAEPLWFLMENVSRAPDPTPAGYSVKSFILNNAWLGEQQIRRRRFWYGCQLPDEAPNLQRWIPGVALELAESRPAVGDDRRSVPVAIGGSGKVKVSAVTGAHLCSHRPNGGHGETYTLEEMCLLQGLPADFFGPESPFTMTAKRKMLGNGVPLAMGRAVARAIKIALQEPSGSYRTPNQPAGTLHHQALPPPAVGTASAVQLGDDSTPTRF